MRAIDEFVRAGGTLVCFNRSSSFAVDQLKLPVKNVVTGLARTQFFVGGSLLNVTVDSSHRVMAGMPERAAIYYDSGPVFETLDGFRGTILAKYPRQRIAARIRFSPGREVHSRQGRRAGRGARCRTRHPARFPPAVAWPAVRHVSGDLQCAEQGALTILNTEFTENSEHTGSEG